MGWQKWAYWLKGATISILIILIQLIFQFFQPLSRSSPGPINEFFINQLYNIFTPLNLISSRLGDSIYSQFTNLPQQAYWDLRPTFLGVILVFVLYISIGTLIGWLYGKLKPNIK
jgi:hypothetical protein